MFHRYPEECEGNVYSHYRGMPQSSRILLKTTNCGFEQRHKVSFRYSVSSKPRHNAIANAYINYTIVFSHAVIQE